MNAIAQTVPEKRIGISHFPCQGQALNSEPLVLVHGWGADSQIWGQLPQLLSQWNNVITLDLPGFGCSSPIASYDLDSLLDWLQTALPKRSILMGLSLGGMLCEHFVARFTERSAGLITLSSNRQFVACENYTTAMPAADFKAFVRSWNADPTSCLNRFKGLQAQGDHHKRQLLRQLRSLDSAIDSQAADQLLRLLGELKSSPDRVNVPRLSMFGEHDALVPVVAAQGRSNVSIVSGAGHLPHLSAPAQLAEGVRGFIDGLRYRLDKPSVADSFGRAAPKYDSAAQLQHRIGEQMLSGIQGYPKAITDLGCGTGYHSIQLQQRFAEASVTGVDISPGMLAYARAKYPQSGLRWLCNDAENLSLASASQTLIFSNFALQWCERLDMLAAELFRVLADNGQLVFAVPGPRTLIELRQAWTAVDNRVHVNRFASLGQWQRALEKVGFRSVELDSTVVTEQHQSVRELLIELKNVGAHNNNAGKSSTMTGKQQLKALYNAYQQYLLPNGNLPATWEIISGSAVK